MIEIVNLTKTLGGKLVLNNLNLTIDDGEIFGLVGINGAGKSTLLRILSTVYDVDSGEVLFDGNVNFDNVSIKKEVFFLPDDPFFPNSYSINDLVNFYKTFYSVDEVFFNNMIDEFNLNRNSNIISFSKGMKRQLFVSLCLSLDIKYLFLDEAFDGLDPLSKLIFKKRLKERTQNKNMTIIISSHSLKELESLCSSYGLLQDGQISKKQRNEEGNNYHKFQLVFNDEKEESFFNDIDVVLFEKEKRVINIVVKGDKKEILEKINNLSPLIVDDVSLDFEETFIIDNKEAIK